MIQPPLTVPGIGGMRRFVESVDEDWLIAIVCKNPAGGFAQTAVTSALFFDEPAMSSYLPILAERMQFQAAPDEDQHSILRWEVQWTEHPKSWRSP